MKLKINKTQISGLLIIKPQKISDKRGFFSETYNKKIFYKQKIKIDFVQDNYSYSKYKYTLRGLHFQSPPYAQDKLVRVLSGSIIDVAVDLRKKSKTYKKHFKIILSKQNQKQLLIPKGFAHGFLTLEKNTEVMYKTSNYYSKKHDKGIFWSDKNLNIKWKKKIKPILSNKDLNNPSLDDLDSLF